MVQSRVQSSPESSFYIDPIISTSLHCSMTGSYSVASVSWLPQRFHGCHRGFMALGTRVKHNMPIFPPIMLCSYAQLLPCYSFPAATYYAHFMLTFTVQIPTKNQRMRQFSSLSDLKSMVACKVEVNTVGSSVSHCQTS